MCLLLLGFACELTTYDGLLGEPLSPQTLLNTFDVTKSGIDGIAGTRQYTTSQLYGTLVIADF
jgi:hypothetical protein